MNYDRAELLDQLAAAYVLGTLHGAARRRFVRLCRTLPRAQKAVEEWELRLNALAVSVPPVQPGPAVWQDIAHRLGHAEKSVFARWWAPALSFAFGLLVAIAGMQLWAPSPEPEELISKKTGLAESYVGLLLDQNGKPAVLANSYRHGKTLNIKTLQPLHVPEGKVLALWALPKEGRPFLLGVMTTTDGINRIEMQDTSEKLLSTVPRLAATFEDAGALPSELLGEQVFTGHCVKLW